MDTGVVIPASHVVAGLEDRVRRLEGQVRQLTTALRSAVVALTGAAAATTALMDGVVVDAPAVGWDDQQDRAVGGEVYAEVLLLRRDVEVTPTRLL